MPNDDLDAIDLRILTALQADGRLSNVELAERVGLSPSPCLRRVKALEGTGHIESYRAQLGRERIRLDPSIHAAAEANALVVKEGISFREAYRRIGAKLKAK